jgi:hypothetical protein
MRKNKEDNNKYWREYYQKHIEDQRRRGSNYYYKFRDERLLRSRIDQLRRKYGLTPEDYQGLILTQGGTCAICQCEVTGKLSIDHYVKDEEEIIVRGLLCRQCNTGLGSFNHNPYWLIRAATYLIRRGFSKLL